MSWRGHNQRVKWQYNNSISNKTLWCHQVLIKYRPLQVTYLAYWGVSWWWGETKQSRAVAPPWAGEECAEVRWLLISNYKYLHFLPLSLLVCSLLSSKTDLNYSITRAFNKPSGCGGSSWKGLQRSWKYFYCSQVSDRQQGEEGLFGVLSPIWIRSSMIVRSTFFWILLFYTSLTNIVNILYLPGQTTTHRQEEILCSFLACQ